MLALLALGSSAAWGTSDFLAGLASRRRHPVAVVGWTQGLALVVLTVVVLARPDLAPWADWRQWAPWAVGAGLAGLGGLVCFYTALSTGTMGVVAPIAGLGVVVPVVLGVVGGDRPAVLAWVGMVVAVGGVTLASGPEIAAGLSVRPVALATGAAVGFGLTLYLLDRGARESTLMTLWGMRVTSVPRAARRRAARPHRRRRDRPRAARCCSSSGAGTSARTPSSPSRPPGAR